MERAAALRVSRARGGAAHSSGVPSDLSGNKRRCVLECLETSWISSLGVFIEGFEHAVCAATGARHAVGVCNGTVALHLALHCLGIGPGDEVIVPSFTYIASVNAIAQTGARLVFAECRSSDCHPSSPPVRARPATCLASRRWRARAACRSSRTAPRPSARLHRRHAGTFGDVGTFSFFGKKTITTGEGGMLITQDDAVDARMRIARGQGQFPTRRYWHETLGYRMTNIVAAIGLAQIERLESVLARKRAIGARYRTLLRGLPVTFQRAAEGIVVGSDAGKHAAAARHRPGPADDRHGGPRRRDPPGLLLRPRDADVRQRRAFPPFRRTSPCGASRCRATPC